MTGERPTGPQVDFSALYDDHPDYVARRAAGSYEQAQIDIEVREFKLPYLLAVLPEPRALHSVLEVGCATGELIAAMPVTPGGRRVGLDISAANIAAARERFGQVEFFCGDLSVLGAQTFDAVILSDVLEHVPDDVAFLRDASAFAGLVLVNLPLEDNWLNRGRHYGANDPSGHLRRYTLDDARALVQRAGLEIVAQSRVWFHETPAERSRRALRRERLGSAYAGTGPGRSLRRAVFAAASWARPLGRRLFASNLFVAARAAAVPGSAVFTGSTPWA